MASKSTLVRAGAVVALVAIVVFAYVAPQAKDERAATPATSPSSLDAGLRSPLPNAQAAYRALEPQMRACFAAQQERSAAARGQATFAVQVDGQGRVADVGVVGDTTYDAPCVACMQGVLRSARFDPPLDRQPVTIQIPVNLLASSTPRDAGFAWIDASAR